MLMLHLWQDYFVLIFLYSLSSLAERGVTHFKGGWGKETKGGRMPEKSLREVKDFH